jgi:hypothetical protein
VKSIENNTKKGLRDNVGWPLLVKDKNTGAGAEVG